LNTWFKTITLSCAIVGAGLLVSGQADASTTETTDIKVQINDEIVNFPTAQPLMGDSTLFVPIRPLATKAGYGLDWHDENGQVVVTFTYENQSITLKTGETMALVNGEQVELSQAPFTKDGSTYVPFRFIGESFGHILQWDDENMIAILGEDGEYHAPAWYRPAPIADKANEVIETAKKYLGTRYVYGGATPSGFDCSGFVSYVYRQYGIELPRSASDMYTAGTKVSNPEPGDLVFFKEGSKVSHVGIYIGDGRYIDAATGNRMKVTYSEMSSPWSSKYYVGAKRVL